MESYDALIERKAAELGEELNDTVRALVKAWLIARDEKRRKEATA